jgi:NADH:ubiquinone oxidoreductase subunit 6 (subunit J)
MDTLPSLVFYALAAATALSALVVVTSRSIFYSAVALIGTLTFVAGIFFLWGADFVGTAQILVYVGGIMIIMLFVIMLSQQARDLMQRQINDQWLAALVVSAVIAISLARAFRVFVGQAPAPNDLLPTSGRLGQLLLGDMLLPFEAVSLILFAALVGAVLFGKEKNQ